MAFILLALFTYSFYYGEAFNVGKLGRCSIKDDNCLKLFYEKAIYEYGKSGIPELGLAPFEPMDIKNISVPVFEVFSFNLGSGVIKGISNCSFNDFHLDMEKSRETLDVTCNLVVEGEMSVTGNGEAVKAVFGKSKLVSRGFGKLSFDEIHIIYDALFRIYKKSDGEVYWEYDNDHVKYHLDLQKVSFSGKNFLFGDTDISTMIVDYFNSNWRELVKNIGDEFLSQSMNQYFANLNKLFGNVPVSLYIIEDLSSYV